MMVPLVVGPRGSGPRSTAISVISITSNSRLVCLVRADRVRDNSTTSPQRWGGNRGDRVRQSILALPDLKRA